MSDTVPGLAGLPGLPGSSLGRQEPVPPRASPLQEETVAGVAAAVVSETNQSKEIHMHLQPLLTGKDLDQTIAFTRP